ncbi:MAG: hypothetical protein QOF49_220 [Chloroflexota bacterium]|jgi:hypothetical protein|nr:hypothetical protein [Chloroflexota bacterium]
MLDLLIRVVQFAWNLATRPTAGFEVQIRRRVSDAQRRLDEEDERRMMVTRPRRLRP